MSVTVKNPTRTIVDLNKMVCYLPEDCTYRRLKIDKARWDSFASDTSKRWSDQHLYYCIMQTTYQDGLVGDEYKHTKTAKDYLIIGNPDYLSLDGSKTIAINVGE